jgi:hypothetical protein
VGRQERMRLGMRLKVKVSVGPPCSGKTTGVCSTCWLPVARPITVLGGRARAGDPHGGMWAPPALTRSSITCERMSDCPSHLTCRPGKSWGHRCMNVRMAAGGKEWEVVRVKRKWGALLLVSCRWARTGAASGRLIHTPPASSSRWATSWSAAQHGISTLMLTVVSPAWAGATTAQGEPPKHGGGPGATVCQASIRPCKKADSTCWSRGLVLTSS